MTRTKSKRIRQSITQQQAQAIPVDGAAHNATAITDGIVATETAANLTNATTGIEQPTQQVEAPQVEQQANAEAVTRGVSSKKPSRNWFSRLLHWLLTPFRWLGKKLGVV